MFEKTKIKYSLSSIVIATFTLLIFLHYWPSEATDGIVHFSPTDATRNGIENSNNAERHGIETFGWKESSNTKYQFFISRVKQSGIYVVYCIITLCKSVISQS